MSRPCVQARQRLLQHPLRAFISSLSPLILQCHSHSHTLRHNSTSSRSTPSPPPSKSHPQTIFSGIQPTGIPHLGNYLGALQNWVRLQNSADVKKGDRLLYSVVDLHAITMKQERGDLRGWKRESLASLLAVGLKEELGSVLFFQSEVQAHCELMWILSCTASMGYLSRMTQWKTKLDLPKGASPLDEGIKSGKTKLKLGLFSYPVLQAADILVHRATHVPVGEDQSQHLEFARECVTNFNHNYGPHLVAPKTILSSYKRVMSLQDPSVKMSKSAPNPLSRILITDSPSDIQKKIMGAITDSSNFVSYDPDARPGVANLLQLLSHFDPQGRSPTELGYEYRNYGLGQFKKLVGEQIAESLEPVRTEFERVMKEPGYLDGVAERGAKKARDNAEETMVIVREAIGL